MDFSQALLELKAGRRVRREVWLCENYFEAPIDRPWTIKRVLNPLVQSVRFGNSVRLFSVNHYHDGEVKMDWMPDYGDLFAADWQVVSSDEI